MDSPQADNVDDRPGRAMPRARRLRAEFGLLFVVAPVLGALLLPPDEMFAMLFAITGLGLSLLHLTPGFRWGEVVTGWGRIDWGFAVALSVASFAAGLAIVWATAPEAMFFLPRQMPALMLMIAVFYPVVSALPQEIVFRTLFFRRYGAILPGGAAALALNAAVFSLAHLMYWSWIVAVLTFAGGLAFAEAYRRHGLPTAVAAHAGAGVALFFVGMGVYFYSGNVG